MKSFREWYEDRFEVTFGIDFFDPELWEYFVNEAMNIKSIYHLSLWKCHENNNCRNTVIYLYTDQQFKILLDRIAAKGLGNYFRSKLETVNVQYNERNKPILKAAFKQIKLAFISFNTAASQIDINLKWLKFMDIENRELLQTTNDYGKLAPELQKQCLTIFFKKARKLIYNKAYSFLAPREQTRRWFHYFSRHYELEQKRARNCFKMFDGYIT
jgi:hypothetical protein